MPIMELRSLSAIKKMQMITVIFLILILLLFIWKMILLKLYVNLFLLCRKKGLKNILQHGNCPNMMPMY